MFPFSVFQKKQKNLKMKKTKNKKWKRQKMKKWKDLYYKDIGPL